MDDIDIDIDTRHRIGRARLLRRQGKTYDEIRIVVGRVRDETLAGWLKASPDRSRRTGPGHSMTSGDVAGRCRGPA
jgi:hypothetical protein